MVLVQREPDTNGPENFDGYSTWERWPGINCYEGGGGATMPEFDPAPIADAGSTLRDCMDLCARTSGCDGVQTQDGDPFRGCWLRTEVDVQDCYEQPPWVMYTPAPKGRFFSTFLANSTSTPGRTTFLVLQILLFIVAVALAVYYLKKKQLLCFKLAEPARGAGGLRLERADRSRKSSFRRRCTICRQSSTPAADCCSACGWT